MSIKQHILSLMMPVIRLYWRVRKPQTFGVKVIVRHPDRPNEVLLIRHSYGNRTLWNIPGGGYNPKKESPQQAAVREVKEELGVDIVDLQYLDEYQTAGEGKRDTVAMFSGTITGLNELKPNTEVSDVSWQNYETLSGRTDVARVARRAAEKIDRS